MNHIQYKQFCQDFFKDKNFDFVKSYSLNAFKDWYSSIGSEYYNIIYKPIREFVALVREQGNYKEPVDQDPLKNAENQLNFQKYKDIFNDTFDKNVDEISFIKEKLAELKVQQQREQLEQELQVTINEHTYQALDMCNVYWTGWDCDDKAWIVEDNGVKKLVTTDNGRASFTDKEFLIDKIKQYQEAIKNTQRLLELL